MAGNNNDNEKKTTLEVGKTTFIIATIIALAMFMLGYLSRGYGKEETVIFTYEEIQMIEAFQTQLETEIGPKAEVIAYKTKDGELMLGWK